jgi:hypothetical protein
MQFPSQETLELKRRRSERQVEMEWDLIHDYLELSSPQLKEAAQWGSTVDFSFTAADIRELQQRQEFVVSWEGHVMTFLNTHLSRLRFPYEVTAVEIEHTGGGCSAACMIAEKAAADA